MWLFNSSIGRKLIMSVTGIALVLFITFHGCMNVVALISKDAYNTICALLGSNWYAIAATLGLAALVVIHIIYAFILTIQNRKARGNNKYAVTEKPDKVEWASQNMLVLGIIICLGLLLHLFNFWYNMMFAEIIGAEGLKYGPADGFNWIKETFLVSYADTRIKRTHLVQALEMYWSDLEHCCHGNVPYRCPWLLVVPRLCRSVRFQVTSICS